jgi:hypothetical protein
MRRWQQKEHKQRTSQPSFVPEASDGDWQANKKNLTQKSKKGY